MKQWSLGCLGDCFYIFINIWVSHNVCHQVAKVVVPGISKGTTAMQITFKKTSTGERLFLFPMTHKKKSNQHHWSSQRHPHKSDLEPCLVSKPGSHCSWQGSTRKSKLKTRVNDPLAEGRDWADLGRILLASNDNQHFYGFSAWQGLLCILSVVCFILTVVSHEVVRLSLFYEEFETSLTRPVSFHTSWVQGPHTDPLSCHLSGQWQLMQVMNNLAQTHSAIHRWCITELCTWNLCVFINQRHPNTFIKRKTEPAVSLVHTPFPWNKCAIILDWCRKKIHFLSLWLSAGICYFDHVKYMNSPSKVHDPQRAALISTI